MWSPLLISVAEKTNHFACVRLLVDQSCVFGDVNKNPLCEKVFILKMFSFFKQ